MLLTFLTILSAFGCSHQRENKSDDIFYQHTRINTFERNSSDTNLKALIKLNFDASKKDNYLKYDEFTRERISLENREKTKEPIDKTTTRTAPKYEKPTREEMMNKWEYVTLPKDTQVHTTKHMKPSQYQSVN
jgi:hypothetical protein